MKKFLAALAMMIFLSGATCSAENVHAIGRGNTERSAIHNAMRMAIEQKFGAAVNAKTLTENFMVVNDKISVDSAGLISSYEIISSRVVNGIYIVELNVELDADKISSRLSELQKKSLVDVNADNPRVAVIAFDSSGQRYAEIENEIISALKRQGFTRTVDLAQVSRVVQQRIYSAAGDVQFCKALANDFHVDCLVCAEVKILSGDDISVSSRLIELNTGEIIFAGSTTGGGTFIDNRDALKLAGRRAGSEISFAALKSAAKVERHLTLLITKNTFEQLGGTLTTVSERIKNILGVNDAFARKLNASLELDIDFDGTATDFARELEFLGIKLLEVSANFVKI